MVVNACRLGTLCFAFLCGLYFASGCRVHPQAFTYVGKISWNNSTVIRDSNSTGISCWVGNGTLLEVVTARAATCMTVSGCKAFTLESDLKGLRSCLLTAAPDVYIPSLDVSCYGVFYKVDGSVKAWGRQSTSPAVIPSDIEGNVASISAGFYNAYALLSTGYKVVGWGNNDFQQLSVPTFDGLVIAVAAGRYHALALLEDGTVRAWGDNSRNQTNVPSNLSNVTAVEAGEYSSVALLGNGTVVAWGYEYRLTSTLQANVAAIAAHSYDPIALLRNGTVVTFNEDSYWPLPEATQDNVTAIAQGSSHSLALLKNGTVVAWGSDEYNQSLVPDAALSNVTAIAAGAYHSLALLRNGTVVAWGDNSWGQCDIVIPSDLTAAGIAGTDRTSLVLLISGTVLGFGHTGTDEQMDRWTQLQAGVAAVSCYTVDSIDRFCQMLLSNSTLIGWGWSTSDKERLALTNVTTMSTGGIFTAALGNGTVVYNYVSSSILNRQWLEFPTLSGSQVAKLASGSDAVHALLTNGSLVSFNAVLEGVRNETSQIFYIFTGPIRTPAAVQSGVVDISLGRYLMLLLSNGTVLVWPGEGQGFLDVPDVAKSGVMAISAGDTYHVALLGNGTLVAWEIGNTSLVNLPRDFRSGVVRVSTGRNHMLIQKADGRIVPFGLLNNYKQLTVPATVTNGQLQALMCGDDVSFAIMTPESPPPTPPAGLEPTVPPPQTRSPPVVLLPNPTTTNTTQPPPLSPASQSNTSPSSSQGPIIGAAVGASAGGILLAGLAWLLVWSRRRQPPREQHDVMKGGHEGSSTDPDGEEAWVSVEVGGKRKAEKLNEPTAVMTASGSELSPETGNSKADKASTGKPDPNSQSISQTDNMSPLNKVVSWKDIEFVTDSRTGDRITLGSGGFGLVQQGKYKGGTDVAVKMVMTYNASAVEKLRSEAMVMKEAHAPGIAIVYGVADNGAGQVAIIMKHYKKGSLASAMAHSHPRGWYSKLDTKQRLTLATQVVAGMRSLHEHEPAIIHGDLKTGNLLIDDDGRTVVITDFGLAGFLPLGQDGRPVTNGALTDEISPPEVFADRYAPRTTAGDVYAFGVVLFEMMVGQSPFQAAFGFQSMEIAEFVRAGKRPSIPKEVPENVASIITECWSQDPCKRPDFKAVSEKLSTVLNAAEAEATAAAAVRGNQTPPRLVTR